MILLSVMMSNKKHTTKIMAGWILQKIVPLCVPSCKLILARFYCIPLLICEVFFCYRSSSLKRFVNFCLVQFQFMVRSGKWLQRYSPFNIF